MKKYLLETRTSLQECSQYENELINFALEVGDSLYINGDFAVNIIDSETFEPINYRVENSRWSTFLDVAQCYSNTGDCHVTPRTKFFDLYKDLDTEGKTKFMNWIHGVWDFSEEDKCYMTGIQEMYAALGCKITLSNGKTLN